MQNCVLTDCCVAVCRIAELEKDLYYYKMTSREFRKKLRSRDSVRNEHEDREIGTDASRDAAAGDDAVSPHGPLHTAHSVHSSSMYRNSQGMKCGTGQQNRLPYFLFSVLSVTLKIVINKFIIPMF